MLIREEQINTLVEALPYLRDFKGKTVVVKYGGNAMLNDEIKKFCPEAKPLKDTYVEHIYDFLYNYASDSGNVPSC